MKFVLLPTYRPPLRNYISSNMRGVTLHHKPMKWKACSKDHCQHRVKKRLKVQHNSRFLRTNPVAIIYSRLRLRRCRHFYPRSSLRQSLSRTDSRSGNEASTRKMADYAVLVPDRRKIKESRYIQYCLKKQPSFT